MAYSGKHDEFCSANARGELPSQERLGLDFVGIPYDDGGWDIDIPNDVADIERHAGLRPCCLGRRRPAQRIVDHMLPQFGRKLS